MVRLCADKMGCGVLFVHGCHVLCVHVHVCPCAKSYLARDNADVDDEDDGHVQQWPSYSNIKLSDRGNPLMKQAHPRLRGVLLLALQYIEKSMWTETPFPDNNSAADKHWFFLETFEQAACDLREKVIEARVRNDVGWFASVTKLVRFIFYSLCELPA